MKRVDYVRRPSPDSDHRYRVTFDEDRGQILRFVVQLEYVEGEDWRPVLRYDTAHGFAHRDRFLPDGTVIQHEPVSAANYNEALTMAVREVRSNPDQWLEPFRRQSP